MIVYLARDISPFVMYCVNGKPRSPLFIESTDSIYERPKKHFKNEQRSKDAAANKRANTSGIGKINNYCEDNYIPPYNNTH